MNNELERMWKWKVVIISEVLFWDVPGLEQENDDMVRLSVSPSFGPRSEAYLLNTKQEDYPTEYGVQ
jgi:hypothetical protein